MVNKTNEISFNVIETIQQISLTLHHSQLNPEVLNTIKDEIQNLAKFLDVTEIQACLFVVIYVQNFIGYSSDLEDIMTEINMKSAKFLSYRQDIMQLIDKDLIKSDVDERKGKAIPKVNMKFMRISDYVSDAINENISLAEAAKKDPLDIYEFCTAVSELISLRSDQKLSTIELMCKAINLESDNAQLESIQGLIELGVENIHGRILLYEMCDDMVRGNGQTAMEKTLSKIYECQKTRISITREIIDQKNILQEKNLMSVVHAPFVNDISIHLTPAALEMLLGQDADLFIKKKSSKDLIACDNILAKPLFFEDKFQKQIDFFQSSLREEKFMEMQRRLLNLAMPQGVAAVFYGAPGTGKTESVYQIAKATGRDILHVDISQTKSMWFGDSEKRIKSIFNDYARLCKKSTLKPILLFNEADAILGKRKDGNASSVAQTENAIQNIILEQMEKTDGIIIATTNLIGNFDEAFERRFLFKLKFETPNKEAKMQIWKSKLEWLDDESVTTLAESYPLSGGEIDNIARKSIINEVITGNRSSVIELIEYCETEQFNNKKTRKMGYK